MWAFVFTNKALFNLPSRWIVTHRLSSTRFALPPLGWPRQRTPSQAREGRRRWGDALTAGHSLAMIQKGSHSSWPQRGFLGLLAQEGSHTLPFIPAKTLWLPFPNPAPAQIWICTNAWPWSFCIFVCLWGSKKIFISFSKQQSSCVSLEFPTWQCAGSWQKLQTKPELWELVWSLHLC